MEQDTEEEECWGVEPLSPWTLRTTPPRPRDPCRPPSVVLLVIAASLLLHALTGGVSAAPGHGGGSNCRVDLCSRLHGSAVQQRGDELALCQSLSSYLKCLRENARSCRGNLKYHTTLRGLMTLVEEYDCPAKLASVPPPSIEPSLGAQGPQPAEFPGRPGTLGPPVPEPPTQECTYKGPHMNEMRHCGLFGDPHLKTFAGDLQTCRVKGAWPLMDSPYLAVQVTTDYVRPGSEATVTTKVTVIVKNSVCSPEKVYEAQDDFLPDTFLDGMTSSGQHGGHSVTLHVIEPNERVEIRVRHLAARLLLRRVAGALSFSAQLPLELALPPGREFLRGSLELCSRGCPASERLDHSAADKRAALQQEAALAVCKARNLSATYLEWCVFDVMTTGDTNFAEAAFAAQADVILLDPSADAVLSAGAKWFRSHGERARTSSAVVVLLLAVLARWLGCS